MRRLLPLVVLAVVISACSGSSPAVTESDLSLFEYGIDVEGSRWAAGDLSLDVTNDGEFAHTLVVTDADGGVVDGTNLVVPGETVSLALDLEPGTYRVSCRIVIEQPDGGLVDHFERGMHATVRVVG